MKFTALFVILLAASTSNAASMRCSLVTYGQNQKPTAVDGGDLAAITPSELELSAGEFKASVKRVGFEGDQLVTVGISQGTINSVAIFPNESTQPIQNLTVDGITANVNCVQ